jgi:Cytochrome P460
MSQPVPKTDSLGGCDMLCQIQRRGSAMKRKSKLTIAIAIAVLAVLGATVIYAEDHAQDKYSLKTSSGMAFSDFRGYEDWSVVSSARTDEVLKVIVANPTMINAYKAGVPGNGQPFPDGSKIAKLQWKPKKSTEAPFVVDVPDTFTQAFVMEKDSKRFPKSGGWGYALFNYEAASDKFTADPSPSDCGNTCHIAVKAKDYIFHPYQKR